MSEYTMPNGSFLGHVNFRVKDLERSIAFYRDVLGLVQTGGFPGKAAFFSSNPAYYHQIVLTATPSGEPPVGRAIGLDHLAVNLPTKEAFAIAVKRLVDNNVTITGTADYGHHLAVYLKDPDGIGIELAWDRDPSEWRMEGDRIWFGDPGPLSIDDLLAELAAGISN
jgi:catechol 2,3-dioxygenase